MITRNGLRLCIGVSNNFRGLKGNLTVLHSHLQYTIPPAIALTFLFYPLWTKIDVYKVLFLIAVSLRICQSSRNQLSDSLDRCCLYNPLGLLPNTQSNMDLSQQCYNWAYSF